MDADGNSGEPTLLVLVRFKTDLGHPYKVPESSISIPASLTCFGLSTVVNNLITSEEDRIYIRAVVPRKEEEPSSHNEWVSAVDGSSPRFFLTGWYDGLGRSLVVVGDINGELLCLIFVAEKKP
ncbi:hypothetical protein ACFX11_024043 [Malus domestica]